MPNDQIDAFLLQEFRLHASDTTGEVARMVSGVPPGIEPAVPLLTSVDDRRDVATVRALHTSENTTDNLRQRTELEPLVESWQRLTAFEPRVIEHSERPPSHYRLAVTDSGINDAAPDASSALEQAPVPDADGSSVPIGLLWIGVPRGSHAGLLVVLGSFDAPKKDESVDWPLALSRKLGVRIYQSA